MDNAALAISRGSAGGGGSSYSGGSGGASSYSGGSGGGYDAAGRAADRATSTYQDRAQGKTNEANRQQIERKLWNMNNPYR
ncbi:MAG: hypothetical protein HY550_04625 [Elusimicrobia bacterium]|nr:hypothetical protein [Elusimicrobiota bacterium]